jgi:hypothetical protein
MTVVEAVEREVETLGSKAGDSPLAAVAFALARELDARNSATSKSMCAKAMVDVLRELRALVPPLEEKDDLDDLAAQRKKRISERARRPAAARPADP